MTKLGEVCSKCAGWGTVLAVRLHKGSRRTFKVACGDCAPVRKAQLLLNATHAAAIARGLKDLDNFDMYGEEYRPATDDYNAPRCRSGNMPDDARVSWVECGPPTW